MNQLSINFDAATKARRDDPKTSKDAAKSADSFVGRHWYEIVQCLKDCGPMGVDKIAQYADMEPHAVGKRMKELLTAGLVELTGNVVESNSGRNQREYRAVTKE